MQNFLLNIIAAQYTEALTNGSGALTATGKVCAGRASASAGPGGRGKSRARAARLGCGASNGRQTRMDT